LAYQVCFVVKGKDHRLSFEEYAPQGVAWMVPPAEQNCPYEAKVENPKVAYTIIEHLKTMGITALFCAQGNQTNGYYSVEINEADLDHLLDVVEYQRQQLLRAA
jgi:hypothetical protein